MSNTQRTDEQIVEEYCARFTDCGTNRTVNTSEVAYLREVLKERPLPTDDSVVEEPWTTTFLNAGTEMGLGDLSMMIGTVSKILTTTHAQHKAEVEKAGLLELVLLRTHLDRQLGGYSTVSVDSLYNYLDERQKHLTNKES